ncbi:MAG: hydrogenase maturation nickel metallochaperone HypA [Anaerolineales bacterium]|nr:hydrogenase maturation nickel metallochaperone HypA [Anaerolineales bacterium]
MHEMAVTQSILEIALRHASEAKHITKLNLVIGELSGIVDDSVQFYWDIITRGTKAEGSLLAFKRVPTQFRCNDCKNEFNPNGRTYQCPECNSQNLVIMAGKELFLESIEVE